MSNRNNTRMEIAKELLIQIPGKVPKEPDPNTHIQCDCDHCKIYNGTYTYDMDGDSFGEAELVQN